MARLPSVLSVVSAYLKVGADTTRIPKALQGLAAEALKYDTFKEFEYAFLGEIKHGTYWHWTEDPDFKIDPSKGPRDMSSLSSGKMSPGKLMVTSHLEYWSDYGSGGKGRPYAALIDMSEVPKEEYHQVNRGFGNEFYVSDPSKAKVEAVYPRARAFSVDRARKHVLPQSSEELQEFYDKVRGIGKQASSEGVESALKRRGVRGDALLDALDLVESLESKGGEVDGNGMATLYHRTTPEAAEAIVREQRMSTKEDGLFFGTKPYGQIEGYGDAVVRVSMPVERLLLDDEFTEEAHVRMPTGTIGRKIPVKAYAMESGMPKVAAYEEITVYHGTGVPFRRFSLKDTAQGILWFSEDRAKIERGESGAQSVKYIITAKIKVDKTAGWDEYDKLFLAQLRSMGYDSIHLDDNWVIFDPKNAKVVKIEERQPDGSYKAVSNSGTPSAKDLSTSKESPTRVVQAYLKSAMEVDADAAPKVSLQEAQDRKLFGPVWHGAPQDRLEKIKTEGFKVFDVGTKEEGKSHGYPEGPYHDGIPAPVDHLGYGVYFTTSQAIAKHFAGGTGRGLKTYYLDVPRLETINFGAPRTMMKWWVDNGYDPELAKTDRVGATKKLTQQLKSQWDAVWFKGKGLRRLLDGDQVCVYDTSRIYELDPKASKTGEAGAKVRRKADGVVGTILKREPIKEEYRPLRGGNEESMVVKWQKGGTDYNVYPKDVDFL